MTNDLDDQVEFHFQRKLRSNVLQDAFKRENVIPATIFAVAVSGLVVAAIAANDLGVYAFKKAGLIPESTKRTAPEDPRLQPQ